MIHDCEKAIRVKKSLVLVIYANVIIGEDTSLQNY